MQSSTYNPNVSTRFSEDDDGTTEASRLEAVRVRRHETALQDPTLLTGIDFSGRPDMHPAIQRALTEGMGLRSMTHVQAETYGPAVAGHSIIATSRTGTGKTLAFLLPSVERLLGGDLGLYRPGQSIGMVVLAPTRELAIQIADQAELLLQDHNRDNPRDGMDVACLYGGVKMQRDVRVLSGQHRHGQQQGGHRARLPAVLVATPGRLLEHLEGNTRVHERKFADLIDETRIVVLDETDRLLQNHAHAMKKILPFLARSQRRQTLLFSATFPQSLRQLLKDSIMKGVDFVQVDCNDGNDGDREPTGDHNNKLQKMVPTSAISTASTNRRVEQSYVALASISQYILLLLAILRREKERNPNDYKLLVFFPASRLVRFLFQFFVLGNLLKGKGDSNPSNSAHIWEIHSRMSQSSRTRASNAFRSAKTGILFSSDVSARGLDYPDVSLVVQFGAPSNDNDYIHRLGRTGRAGQSGRGLLVLLPFERDQRRVRRLLGGKVAGPMKEDPELASWIQLDNDGQDDDDTGGGGSTNNSNGTQSSLRVLSECREALEATRFKVRSGHVVLTPSAEVAYKSFLAYYIGALKQHGGSSPSSSSSSSNTNKRMMDPADVLRYAAEFASATGLSDVPNLEPDIESKLGL